MATSAGAPPPPRGKSALVAPAPQDGPRAGKGLCKSAEHRFELDDKCALTISRGDEFPGTPEAMLASPVEQGSALPDRQFAPLEEVGPAPPQLAAEAAQCFQTTQGSPTGVADDDHHDTAAGATEHVEGMLHEAPGSASADSMDLEQHTAPHTTALCEECKHQSATAHCSSCRADLCANCWPTVHSSKLTGKHTREPLVAMQSMGHSEDMQTVDSRT